MSYSGAEILLGFVIGSGGDVSWWWAEPAAEGGEAGEALLVGLAEAGLVLPVAVEGAAVIVEFFLGKGFR